MLISNSPRRRWRWLAAASAMLMASASTSHAQTAVDHQRFDDLLHRHVINGFVDYDAFAQAPEFGQYLASLDKVRLDGLSEDERLAFWLNVYNAYTIQLVVEHHETSSIRNINRTLWVLRLKGPWSEPLVHAAGRTLSLDDVHHAILRKEFGEPRVHYALACAAVSCPPLRSEAYTGAKLVDQLNDQGKRFLRESPTKNRIEQASKDMRSRVVYLSPILTAYRGDFGPARQDLGRAIAPWFDGEDRLMMEKGRFFQLETDFDWTLNSQAQARRLKVM